jgi:hypothetical protein
MLQDNCSVQGVLHLEQGQFEQARYKLETE